MWEMYRGDNIEDRCCTCGGKEFYRTVSRGHVLGGLLIARRWAGVKESTSIQLSIRMPLSFALLSISAVSIVE